jgi:hypothetical protein
VLSTVEAFLATFFAQGVYREKKPFPIFSWIVAELKRFGLAQSWGLSSIPITGISLTGFYTASQP